MIAYGLGWLLDAGGIYSPYLLFSLLHVLSGALSIVSVLAFTASFAGRYPTGARRSGCCC